VSAKEIASIRPRQLSKEEKIVGRKDVTRNLRDSRAHPALAVRHCIRITKDLRRSGIPSVRRRTLAGYWIQVMMRFMLAADEARAIA
jgi:hypothetical protein